MVRGIPFFALSGRPDDFEIELLVGALLPDPSIGGIAA
jgi:hypothetical protein